LKRTASEVVGTDGLFNSYAQLTADLCEQVTGSCLLRHDLSIRATDGQLNAEQTCAWLRSLGWGEKRSRESAGTSGGPGQWLTAIPLQQSDGELLGVWCIQQQVSAVAATSAASRIRHVLQRLRPVLDSLHRELAAASPQRARAQTLTERTAELEWLFKVTSSIKSSSNDQKLLDGILAAASERIDAALGLLLIPDKRLRLECLRNSAHAVSLRKISAQTEQHLMTWATRQQRPLVVNGSAAAKTRSACKIMSVPIVRDSGRTLGVMAFFNTTDAPDFASRHVFLARHLGRQMASLIDSQFDLMTGLYTRDGAEQLFARHAEQDNVVTGSVIYIDVDHMHVVNELHGFELGNELIVRVAELLTPPRLPQGAIAARITGDRFAIIVPDMESNAASAIAQELQRAAKLLKIGPAQEQIEVSLSCGVATLVVMPQGLQRALAAAELACKGAKKHGRDRVETYACGDDSMMRRHDDVVAVGKLRAALKADSLLLYAQRIVPLRDQTSAGGYEVLMRMRDKDGSLIAPGSLLAAAQRYQLLPSVDRWVVARTLQILSAFRSLLNSSGVSISINVSGQSIGDEAFTSLFTEQLRQANLPRGSITVEITEQTALTSLGQANDMIARMTAMGCRIALDDFGTGANSLAYLKGLQISRVKIDGSFVRDIVSNRRSQATVRGIVELARGFSVDTVAEYVEDQAIADKVRELGVDYAQGYAFGKPEPLEQVLARLGQDESRRLHRLFLEI
jgi:diguanylate cyclase (GGDEF)-like protein